MRWIPPVILFFLFIPAVFQVYFPEVMDWNVTEAEMGGTLPTDNPQPPLSPKESDKPSKRGLYDLINYDDVVVIYNVNSEVSREIMENFTVRRGIPSNRTIGVDVPERETIDRTTFNQLRTQVENALRERNLTDRINYMVTTKGVPLRVWGPGSSGSASVDAELALILGPYAGYIGGAYWLNNPYYGKHERFSRQKYGFYIVTRLTGYNLSDTLSLIERAERSGGARGTFLLDIDPGKGGGYAAGNRWLEEANTTLSSMGFKTHLDRTTTFVTDFENCSGYASWGSNDGHYSSTWNSNPGFESGSAPWEFTGEGELVLNTTSPYRGRRCLEVRKNTSKRLLITQNVSVRGSVAYYLSGHVNMTGGAVHFTAEVFSSTGSLLMREEGGVVRGPTSSWVPLRQLPLKPLPPAARKLKIIINLSGEGRFFFDEVRVLEVKPHNSWIPGAIAETYVSTSGRTFTWPPHYGQSLIADLIREGVSGVKGYVYEPYLSAMAEPNILFPRYVSGYTMGESYYMASPFLSWMGVVVGDPKMTPYGLQAELTSLSINGNLSAPGGRVSVVAGINNTGFGDIYGLTLHLQVEGDETILDLYSEVDIRRGARTKVFFNITVESAGDYRVLATLNPNGTLPLMTSVRGVTSASFHVNSPPVITTIRSSRSTLRRGEGVSFDVVVEDSDDPLENLTLDGWIEGPGGEVGSVELIPEGGKFQGDFLVPINWSLGFSTFHVIATDSSLAAVEGVLPDAFFIFNNPPEVKMINWTVSVRRGEVFSVFITVEDRDTPPVMISLKAHLERDGDVIDLSSTQQSPGTFNLSGVIPPDVSIGFYNLVLEVNDGVNTTSQQYMRAVEILNSQPVIHLLTTPPKEVVRGGMFSINVVAEDLEDSRLRIQTTAGAGISVETREVATSTWEVSVSVEGGTALGRRWITIWAEDRDGGRSEQINTTFEVVNCPPKVRMRRVLLTPGETVTGNMLSTLVVHYFAEDLDTTTPVNLTVNVSGHLFSTGEVLGRGVFRLRVWGNLTPGRWRVRVEVRDYDGGFNTTEWFTFSIVDLPPEIVNIVALSYGDNTSLEFTLQDPDLPPGEVLTVRVISGGAVLYTGRVPQGHVKIILPRTEGEITINASDGYRFAESSTSIEIVRGVGGSREKGGGLRLIWLATGTLVTGTLAVALISLKRRVERGEMEKYTNDTHPPGDNGEVFQEGEEGSGFRHE